MNKTDKLIRKSGSTIGGIWLLMFVMLCTTALFVSTAAGELGWGRPDAQSIMSTVAGDDVPDIIYTNDWRNCGGSRGAGGCFSTFQPDVIYVSPNLRYEMMKYVVLHELAHYKQYEGGNPIDECDADAQAKKWGADTSNSSYECD